MSKTLVKLQHHSSGIAGLDLIMLGGYAHGHIYLIEGEPGTGKTTAALQFLLDGANRGYHGLYIALSETEDELRRVAAGHGWEVPKLVTFVEVVPAESLLDADQHQTLLYSSDLELGETTTKIFQAFEKHKPKLVVIDSLSEIRLLAQSSLRYRRQILALKHYFSRHDATVLALDDLTTEMCDKTVHSVAHGVIGLNQRAPDYGAERRQLRVLKYRGQGFLGGFHDFVIEQGGICVFPRLVAAGRLHAFEPRVLASGVPALDQMLGGGINAGSSTLILGPAGGGKTTIALLFAVAAIARGDRAALFLFDEEVGILALRLKALGIDLDPLVRDGSIHIEQVDAAELSPGEFAHRVCTAVESRGISTVVIDSLNGFQAAMPNETQLLLHIHELLLFLNRRGANALLTVAQHGLMGQMKSPIELTYLADTVILLRYFEAQGAVRRAISVVKKRMGKHEPTLREFGIGDGGVWVGDVLSNFHGVLSGTPDVIGNRNPQEP